MATKSKIILLGGGGHCKSCIDVIEQQGKYEIAGILDLPEKIGLKILKYQITGTDEQIALFAKKVKNFLITVGQIGTGELRKRLFEKLKKQEVKLPSIISPYAYVSPYAKVGEGTIIMHDVIVNAGAVIGNNCILNSRSLVEYDAVVQDHCHISTGSIVNAGVTIGNNSFLGSGSTTKQFSTVPPYTFVKASSIYKE